MRLLGVLSPQPLPPHLHFEFSDSLSYLLLCSIGSPISPSTFVVAPRSAARLIRSALIASHFVHPEEHDDVAGRDPEDVQALHVVIPKVPHLSDQLSTDSKT